MRPGGHRQGRVLISRRVLLGASLSTLVAACAGGGGTGSLSSVSQGLAVPTAGTGSPVGAGSPVKVALLLPLSKGGEATKVATDLKQAGELALFEFDKPNIVLVTKDTLGTPQGAEAAARSAIAEGAELIIGPLFAQEVAVVAPIARQSAVPVVAFSSDRKVAGSGVYLLSFVAGEELPRALAYATSQGKRRFVALVPQSPYGDIIEQSFRATVPKVGAQVVAVERYPLDANGMQDPIKRLAGEIKAAATSGAPVDALLFPGGQDTLPTVSSMLPYNDIDTGRIKLIGTGGWDYPGVGNETSLIGGWFAAADPTGWRDFTQRYAKSYGGAPARIASLGYDAVSLAIALAGNPAGERYNEANLTRSSGFAGIDGLFRLRADGTCERGLAMLEVQKFGPRVIDPAPSAFSIAQF